MKIRNGHVSNSSSSSFVIYTGDLLDDIKKDLQKILLFHEVNDNYAYETSFYNYGNFIIGEFSHHNEEICYDIEKLVPEEYWTRFD